MNLKLSEAMKKAHASGKHPGWAHINAQKDRLSYPERFLKEVLSNNGILSKFTVVPHLSVGKYFLDFAILELKLDIEIDGIQHIRTEKARLHDKTRDAFLKESGWTIYRISWKEMMNNSKNEIEQLIDFLSRFDSGLDRYYDVQMKEEYRPLPRGEKIARITDEKWEPYKSKVRESSIDFSRYGWVGQVSRILELSPAKVNRWMKRYLPDVYETSFKRK